MTGHPSGGPRHAGEGRPSNGARPSALARFVAGLGVDREDRPAALADLDERFLTVASERGAGAARRWYWWQALRGIGHRLVPDADLLSRKSWEGVWGDMRLRARMLVRRPVYSFGVLGTLALGLASATVVGALAWTVWLSPLPFPDPDRVVRLLEVEPLDAEAGPEAEASRWRLSPPLLEDLRDRDWTTVSAVAGVARNAFDWQRNGELSRVTGISVSPEFFDITGVRPLHGRIISDDPEALEVVLTDDLWIRAYGADPSVVGRETMMLNGEPYSVVGVVDLPSPYPGAGDVLVPLSWSEEQLTTGMRGARYLDVIARVRPTFTVADAADEMARIIEETGRVHPNHAGWSGDAAVLSDELMEPYRGALAMLLAAGVTFLLLAVVNVGGLVTARSVEAGDDRGVRLAVGASHGRLMRESVVESTLLSASAGLVALALAHWLLPAVKRLVPADVPRVELVELAWPDTLLVMGIAIASGVLIGAVSHAVAQRTPVSARRSRGGTARAGGRNAVVAGQVALTVLLASAGAGVLATSVRLQNVDLGFEPDGVSSTQVMLSSERYPDKEARRLFWRNLLDEMDGRGLTASFATSPPMAGVNMPWGYRIEATDDQYFAQYHIVSPDYFSIIGIELLDGRTFSTADDENSPGVVVVNEALAREHFPEGDAVGRRIQVVAVEKTIVGVVEGARHFGPDQDVPPEIYAPYGQDPWPHAQIIVPGDPADMAGVVASVADAVDPTLGLPPLTSYDRFVTEWFAGLRLQLVIVGILSTVGTLLATLGLYALVAYRVSARRREIGVRLALGATASRVFAGVVRHGLIVTAVGLAMGLAVWYATGPVTREWLGDGQPQDAWIPLLVAVAVAATCALATALPARGSVRVDPARTLREE